MKRFNRKSIEHLKPLIRNNRLHPPEYRRADDPYGYWRCWLCPSFKSKTAWGVVIHSFYRHPEVELILRWQDEGAPWENRDEVKTEKPKIEEYVIESLKGWWGYKGCWSTHIPGVPFYFTLQAAGDSFPKNLRPVNLTVRWFPREGLRRQVWKPFCPESGGWRSRGAYLECMQLLTISRILRDVLNYEGKYEWWWAELVERLRARVGRILEDINSPDLRRVSLKRREVEEWAAGELKEILSLEEPMQGETGS